MKARGRRGQAGIEYMIIMGFITFAVIIIMGIAFYYSDKIKDQIRINQIDGFSTQLINSAESVFFEGEPSKITIQLYVPSGVENININPDSIVVTLRTSSGDNILFYKSKVPLQGSISATEGIKKLTLDARENYLSISQ